MCTKRRITITLTYKTESIVEKIKTPVICVIDGVETEYESGAAMYAHEFEKNYAVESISVRDSKVLVTLAEWKQADITWIGEEAVAMTEA